MDPRLIPLRAEGLRQYRLLRSAAVSAVTERFYAADGIAYEHFGPRGCEACREDLAFHLEFLQPVLEFGSLQPMVDYLRWLASVLAARGVPGNHLALSLDLLAAFFAASMDVADAVVVATALQAARKQFLEVERAQPPKSPEPLPEVAQFESALLAGHQRGALAVLNRCLDDGRSLVEVELQIIKPSLYNIGERWQANQVSVASEHLATAIAQSVMTVGLLRSAPPPTIGRRVLLACVAGNEHALGLRMVADAFQLSGWDVQYLGANVPSAAITQHAMKWKADIVGLSVSFPQQLPIVREITAQLGQRLSGDRAAVIIGGIAINRFNRLAEMVGADAFSADPQAAVACASRLVSAGASDALVRA
jgi:methylmalonyl-CoA mutase cobalamin-binding domain/chain